MEEFRKIIQQIEKHQKLYINRKVKKKPSKTKISLSFYRFFFFSQVKGHALNALNAPNNEIWFALCSP